MVAVKTLKIFLKLDKLILMSKENSNVEPAEFAEYKKVRVTFLGSSNLRITRGIDIYCIIESAVRSENDL